MYPPVHYIWRRVVWRYPNGATVEAVAIGVVDGLASFEETREARLVRIARTLNAKSDAAGRWRGRPRETVTKGESVR